MFLNRFSDINTWKFMIPNDNPADVISLPFEHHNIRMNCIMPNVYEQVIFTNTSI